MIKKLRYTTAQRWSGVQRLCLSHLFFQITYYEVQQERLALAEGAGNRQHDHLPIPHLLRQQDLLQSLVVQLKSVVWFSYYDLRGKGGGKGGGKEGGRRERGREGGRERGREGGRERGREM